MTNAYANGRDNTAIGEVEGCGSRLCLAAARSAPTEPAPAAPPAADYDKWWKRVVLGSAGVASEPVYVNPPGPAGVPLLDEPMRPAEPGRLCPRCAMPYQGDHFWRCANVDCREVSACGCRPLTLWTENGSAFCSRRCAYAVSYRRPDSGRVAHAFFCVAAHVERVLYTARSFWRTDPRVRAFVAERADAVLVMRGEKTELRSEGRPVLMAWALGERAKDHAERIARVERIAWERDELGLRTFWFERTREALASMERIR